MKTPNTSIIIPTYNRHKDALRLAKKINYLNKDVEVIIVNQGPKLSRSQNPKMLILNLKYPNLAKARNLGIKKARGKIVIFLDDDVKITKQTVPSHINSYTDSSVLAVSGRVINPKDKLEQNLNINTGKTNKIGSRFLYRFYSKKRQYVDFPYGCNMSFRKSVFRKAGCFDENYPPPLSAFEELDMAARILKLGKIKFEPAAIVYHRQKKHGGTRLSQDRKMKLYYQSYGYYLAKNIIFPLSLFSMMIRTYHALKEAPYAIIDLYLGIILFFTIVIQRKYKKVAQKTRLRIRNYFKTSKTFYFFDRIKA